MHRRRQSRDTRLWLVRHGESTWNALGLVQGQTATPALTARGLRQARRCASTLAGEPVAAVCSSDLRRAVDTARYIGRILHLEVAADPRLRERSLGVAEGQPAALLGPDRSGISDGRVVDADAAPAGGESIRAFYRRVSGAVAERLSAGVAGDLVLVCHGGVVRVVLAWLAGVGPDEMAWDPVGNGLVVSRPVPWPVPTGQVQCAGAVG